ncbi:MAG: extracellular solute-binding protein [Alphaproteobacteria bacterium]|nr:extracellular solute-binding protein [Alphaproteobacteria bacterium]
MMRRFLAVLFAAVIALPALAAAPAPTPVTPALVEAATKEKQVSWYTAIDLSIAERIARAFEAKYPGLSVQVQRSGAERNFQRIAQERASNVHAADVIDSSDAAHFAVWKRQGWLAPYVPEDVTRHFPEAARDADGAYAIWRATLCIIGYNTKLLPADEAPKSFAELLEPKWTGKLVKAHPGYSGTILTATYQMARDLGWPYFEKLSKQRVLQVQSAVDPPKKLAAGERPVMVDGTEASLTIQQDAGQPVAAIYPREGAPFIAGGSAILVDAPHPHAARLFHSFLFSLDGQQVIVDAGYRSQHDQVKERPGRTPLSQIKLMADDPAAVEAHAEEIKKRYTQYFRI